MKISELLATMKLNDDEDNANVSDASSDSDQELKNPSHVPRVKPTYPQRHNKFHSKRRTFFHSEIS
jgi:hypothetical protein